MGSGQIAASVWAGATVMSARQQVEEVLRDQGSIVDVDAVVIAVHEALINADRHGGGLREVSVKGTSDLVRVTVTDRGQQFEPYPYMHQQPDVLAERGRGLWLIRQIADVVEVAHVDGGNRVTMEFRSVTSKVAAPPPAATSSEEWSSLRPYEVIETLGGAALVIDEHLTVRECYGQLQRLFGLDAGAVVGRDFRGLTADMKRRFADGQDYESRVLAEFAHPDQRRDEVEVMADGRLLRRYSTPVGGNGARLVVYLPAGEQTELLAQMQQAMLPPLPSWPDLDIGAIYHPAQATAFVGGDFYDFFELTVGGRCALIGDISGRGAAAAASSTAVRAYLRASLGTHGVAAAVASLDATLTREFQLEEFVTLAMCVQESTDVWTLTNCGHTPALLLRNGVVTELSAGGPLLGLGLGGPWTRQPFVLRSQDILLLYTDGVLDARHGEEFGMTRLTEALVELAELPAQQLVEAIDARVHAFSLDRVSDDHVIVALRVP